MSSVLHETMIKEKEKGRRKRGGKKGEEGRRVLM